MDLQKYAGKKIRDLRESRNWRQEDLANRLGVVKQAISKYEAGERKLNQDILFDLADIFDVTIDIFFPPRDATMKHKKNKENSTNKNLVPVVGKIAAGAPTYAVEDIIGYMSLPPDVQKKDSMIYLEVGSDSMNEKFPVGSYVLVDTAAQVENGEVAAIRLNGNEATLKKIKFQDDGKNVMLIPESTNEDYYPYVVNIEEAQLHIIGKVVGMYCSV